MRKIRPLLLFLLIIPSAFFLLKPGFFVSDDGDWMIIRFSSFYQELSNFQIPVRYLHRLNNGYGYPVATFLYPGFMYIASIFKFIGFGYISSVKAVFLLSIISSFFGIFLWLKNRFSFASSTIGALAYIYNPYFLWDIYKRGSVGEILSLAILSFILFFIDKEKRVIGALLTGLLIISHNTLSILLFPIIIFYVGFIDFQNKSQKSLVLIRILTFTILSLGTSSFFWLPAIYELPLTIFSATEISNYSSYFVTNLSLIGPVHLLLTLSVFIFYLLMRKKRDRTVVTMLCITLVSIFFSTQLSSFLWSQNFLGKYIQFPFRFLSVNIVSSSFLTAYALHTFSIFKNKILTVSIGIFFIISSIPFLSTIKFTNKEESFYSTNQGTTTVKNEYLPVWVKQIPTSNAITRIEKLSNNSIQINTIFWPGYSILINGKKVPFTYSNEFGVMRVQSNASNNDIQVVFKETPLRLLSDIISTIFLIFSMYLIKRKSSYV